MLSMSHLLILLVVVLIVFGAGKMPKVMGDFGKGIKNFRDGLKGDIPDEQEKKLIKHDKDEQ